MRITDAVIRNNFLYIGILCVLIACSFLSWTRNQLTYDRIKTSAISRFELIEDVSKPRKMPKIEIAGPNGDIIILPEEGHFMLINLWSAKCGECITEIKNLKKLQQIFSSYGENWNIISVSVDNPEDIDLVAEAINKFKLPEQAEYYDIKRNLHKLAAPKTIPATIIIDDKGYMIYKIYGNAPWFNTDVINFMRAMQHMEDK